jgi:hypothetical protein
MPTPSLLIVPSRFKSGKLYSQIPTSGAGDFTVTRATTATRVNASGLIESVASGIPRLDYFASGGTVGCPALLVEPSGSNSVLRSQDFSATWAATVSATVTGVTSPDGTANASIFMADSTSNRVRQSVSLVSGTTYTYSLFGKFDALSSGFTMNVFEENTTAYGSGVCQAFNLNEGTLGASGSVGAGFTLQSAGMENYGNGWYRCRMTVLMGYTTPSGATGGRVGFRIGTQIQSGRPLSVVSGSVSAWGAQLETGSVATSYIPTTTAAVTRNADVISVSGAVSGSIGQASGTIYIECQSEFATNDIIVINTAGQSPGNNFVSITKTPTNVFRLTIFTSGTIILIDQASAITSFAKIAVAYASGNTALFINGTQIGSTDTTGFSFNAALNNITFISNMITGTKPTRIRAVALYNTRLTNAELAALTTP